MVAKTYPGIQQNQMEPSVTPVNGLKPLTNIKKDNILGTTGWIS